MHVINSAADFPKTQTNIHKVSGRRWIVHRESPTRIAIMEVSPAGTLGGELRKADVDASLGDADALAEVLAV